MLVFGHVGITAGAVHALWPRADLRRVALAALLPDLVDKPVAFLLPQFANGWTRNVAHGLTGLVFFTAVVALAGAGNVRERLGRAAPLAFAYGLHLVLDRMWLDGHVLLWPWDGFWFAPHPLTLTERWWRKLFDVWTLAGETVGLALCAAIAIRAGLRDPERRRRFLATGSLEEP